MSIEQQLKDKFKECMKAKDLKTANVVRMIMSRVTEKRTSKGFSGEVDDKLYLEVIAAYKKSLDKAKKEFAAAGEKGAEQIAELDFETDFCQQFLPEQLGEDAVRAAVKEAIAELGGADPKMSGRIVGAVMKKHKGLVEAALVKKLVEEEMAAS
jgi:uncharacterized protein YqeY